jgi:hypothetical protein
LANSELDPKYGVCSTVALALQLQAGSLGCVTVDSKYCDLLRMVSSYCGLSELHQLALAFIEDYDG